jgi:AraC-like DNA-binding protein
MVQNKATTFELFQRLNDRWNYGTSAERSSCRAILLELLIEILGETERYFAPSPPQPEGGHLAGKVRNLLNHIADNDTTSRLSLEAHMEKLGYSYPHLCRAFKKAYGVSPVTYLNNTRMERACMLLRDTELRIAEIARSVGIPNPAYFTRLFSRYTGKPPREYRDEA